MPPRSSRASARLLAPLALIACALAVLVILAGSLGGGDAGDSTPTPQATEDASAPRETSTTPQTPANYTVQENDTLGAIAEKTGVSVETIQLLNPEVDPQALIAGQKLKLRE
jgi:LysM repeat protein